jgi:hypothetical protein
MASLDNIANVSIALQSTGVSAGEFGIPLIVGPHMAWADLVKIYENYPEAEGDNLPPVMLRAVSDCFAQDPKPAQVKVGRRTVDSAIVTVSSVVNAATYTITVAGEAYSYTADSSATATEIVTGLAAAIAADTNEIITGTVVGSTLSLEWNSATVGAVVLGSRLAWGAITGDSATVSADLTAILDVDADWYGLVLAERTKAIQLSAAAWAETTEKLFNTASSEAGILVSGTTDDLFSQLRALGYNRTAAIYSANAGTEFPDAALAGRCLTIQSGSETWALKSLSGITSDNLTSTQRATVHAKGGNTFDFYQTGLTLTAPGKVMSGEWIDVIRFRDWLKDQIQVNMVTMMIGRDKVPYTDAGIQLCVNNLRATLAEGHRVGGIAPDELDATGANVPGFTITYPKAADVSSAVKATRTLALSFKARLAGAIHATTITGTLAYSL